MRRSICTRYPRRRSWRGDFHMRLHTLPPWLNMVLWSFLCTILTLSEHSRKRLTTRGGRFGNYRNVVFAFETPEGANLDQRALAVRICSRYRGARDDPECERSDGYKSCIDD